MKPLRSPILFLWLCCLLLSCESLPEYASNADWADVTLRVTGRGIILATPTGGWSPAARMGAIRQAKIDTYQQLEAQMMSLKTAQGMTVSEWVADHPELSPKIPAYARGATILRTENLSNAIEVSATLYLGENFKSVLGLSQKKLKPISQQGGDHAPSFQ